MLCRSCFTRDILWNGLPKTPPMINVGCRAMRHAFRGRPALLLAAAFVILWLTVDGFFLPPDFGAMDIYAYKDAGINLAEGIGFVTRTSYGNPSFEYHHYVQYPPLYPLLFGAFVKLFGVSALMNQLFNSLISTIVGIIGFLALKPLLSSLLPRRASFFASYVLAISLVSSVCTGFYFPIADRPDGLGIGFGMLAVLVLNQSDSRQNEIIAGSLSAIALCTSVFAGVWTSVVVACIVIARHYSPNEFRRVVSRLFVVGSGALLTLIVGAILQAVFVPDWFYGFQRFVTSSTTPYVTTGGYFLALLKGDVRTWLSGFQFHIYYIGLAKLLVVQCALVGAVILDRIRSGDCWQGQPIVALLVLSPLCMIVTPYQVFYLPMTAALVIVAAASITLNMLPASRRYYAAAIMTGFALMNILSFPYLVRKSILRAGTRPSMERALAFIDRNRTSFDDPERFLSVSPETYILWRQMGIRPLDGAAFFGFDDAENRKKLAYVALSYPPHPTLSCPSRNLGGLRSTASSTCPSFPNYRLSLDGPVSRYRAVVGHGKAHSMSDETRRNSKESVTPHRAFPSTAGSARLRPGWNRNGLISRLFGPHKGRRRARRSYIEQCASSPRFSSGGLEVSVAAPIILLQKRGDRPRRVAPKTPAR